VIRSGLGLTELEHLLDALDELRLGGNTRAVDVVDTRADVAGVVLVNEDLEELGIGLGVLNGENIGIQGGDGWSTRVSNPSSNLGCVENVPWKKSWNSE
jgi:hypothetical protein